MRPSPALLLLGAAGAPLAAGLNNGLGLTPLMGFSSWNAFSSNVSSAVMRNITRILIESGLAAKGYNHVSGLTGCGTRRRRVRRG
jgi:alpha-galactosidase